jgi:hypothetical protein
MLSSFEEALLDRHLAGCASCNAFATAATAETTLLRAAKLEELPVPIVLPRTAPHPLRRSASGLAAAALAAVAAVANALQEGQPARCRSSSASSNDESMPSRRSEIHSRERSQRAGVTKVRTRIPPVG